MDVLAVNNFGDTRSGGLAGPMGLFLIVLMCVATVLLIRNMNKRIRRLPDSFPVAGERDRVAEIARPDGDLERAAVAADEDVEANRSATAAAAEDAEVEAGADGERGSTGGSGTTRV